ncbi:hypothetical protein T459_08783 [Capsicum annuum]|uniref:Ubiquitin-like protease family profile domain-containing protein n=1 Tax=Capsicum annuum TaxID=4072 RepID=A0A2G2ZXG3_CAPAN|nr:hypothetical protein T459_08783 [Capsicum annuum]
MFMDGMFSKFVYNNIRPTHKEVQSLDLQMIEEFELNNDEFGFSPETAAGHSGKRPIVDIQLQSDRDIQGFEDFSTLSPTEILKKAGLLFDASASQHTKRHMTVRFDSATVEEIRKWEKKKQEMYHLKIRKMMLKILKSLKPHKKKEKDIDSADDPMDVHYFDWNRSPIQEQSEDVEGCCEDIATSRLDAFVKFVVNQNPINPNVGTPSTVYINKDHMDVERVSNDIGPTTLESLIAVVENLKPDSANIETSTMQVDYLSTLPESAQVESDVILKGIAASVDDLPIEVVPLSETIVNKHDISDSQLPPDFSDAVVTAHQAAKIPAKRTRMKFKVFMSPYTTEYASGSKAIEDQIGEPKQKFTFDDFLISDNMSRGVIKEYKQWVEEELLIFHAKKFTTTNCVFKNFIVKTYSNYYEDDTDTVITTQQDYAQFVDVILNEDGITNIIKGYCMPSDLPCHQVDEMYIPINCNEKFHWVLAVIALKDKCIRVYDSLSSLRNMKSINEINKLTVMLSTYLSDSRFFEETSHTDWANLETYRDKITQRT